MQPKDTECSALIRLYKPLDGVRLNLAVDSTGAVSGATGSSNDVSNPLDRSLLIHLRKQADVIITSAATARAENLRASKHAPMVVISQSGDVVGLNRLLSTPDAKPVTVLVAEGVSVDSSKASFVKLQNLAPQTVLTYLRDVGFTRILLEFGPRLIASWSQVGLIDEVCLSVTNLPADNLLGERLHAGSLPQAELATYTWYPSFLTAEKLGIAGVFYSANARSLFLRFSLR